MVEVRRRGEGGEGEGGEGEGGEGEGGEEEKEEKRRRGRGGAATDIKPNNPHLAGGEKSNHVWALSNFEDDFTRIKELKQTFQSL